MSAPSSIAHWNVSLDWSEEEQRALETGLARFPPTQGSPLAQYVRIALALPRKSVREVALRARWTKQAALLKKRRTEELESGESAAKRPLLHNPLLQVPQPSMPNWPGSMGGLGPIMMPSHPGPVPASAAPAPPPAQERATPAPGPGRGGASLGSLLEANLALLQQFKGNMTHFRVHDNTRLLVQFRDNILAVIKQMESMDGVMAQMPQLPVRLNVDLANNFLPSQPLGLVPALSDPASLTHPSPASLTHPSPASEGPGMVPLGNGSAAHAPPASGGGVAIKREAETGTPNGVAGLQARPRVEAVKAEPTGGGAAQPTALAMADAGGAADASGRGLPPLPPRTAAAGEASMRDAGAGTTTGEAHGPEARGTEGGAGAASQPGGPARAPQAPSEGRSGTSGGTQEAGPGPGQSPPPIQPPS
uniref:Myb-like domain-containing protein n=1 Tax=Auxenochlorella protothecoides TaxID=3075 RepID=A0A1D2AF69_AUXPR